MSLQLSLQVVGMLIGAAFTVGQECLQPKVSIRDASPETAHVTGADHDGFGYLLNHGKANPQLPQVILLDGHGLDVASDRSRQTERVGIPLNLNLIATQQLPACLLEGEGFVLLRLLERRSAHLHLRAPRLVVEEALIGLVLPLGKLLHSLTADLLPEGNALTSPQLAQMTLQPRLTHVFPCHLVG